jgi:acetyl-CoA carboxylase carboxyltransferase component
MEPDIHTTAGKLADLLRRDEEAVRAGAARAAARQHAKGRKTARERIDLLLDAGSFIELDELARHRSTNFGQQANRPYGDGVVTGYGTIDNRPVCVFSQDAAIFGGSLGEVYGEKIVKVMALAMRTGCPIIGINEGGGARIQEGVVSLALYGEIFLRNTHASGVIPQISLIMGSCAGGHVYSPALTDFTVMVDQTSAMFITGPDVIRAVTGEEVGFEELGGGRTHNTKSGNAHYLGTDEEDALSYVKELLSFLPSNNLSEPPVFDAADISHGQVSDTLTDSDRELDTLIPDSAKAPYDIHEEWNGIIRRGAKLIYSYAEATVPKVTVITRKAYGGAYDVMGSKHLGADLNLAWPTAQIAVMGASGAANILYRKELAAAAADQVDALRARRQQAYEDTLLNPYVAADRGYVDAVIPPSHTRSHVARGLRMLKDKRQTLPPKKHGNIPL